MDLIERGIEENVWKNSPISIYISDDCLLGRLNRRCITGSTSSNKLSKIMCWSDIFFPGNSKKITMLEECGTLKDLLGDCFTAVNHLIDRIEENFPGEKLEKIYVQTSACLGDNCIIIIERINQIEKLLEENEFGVETRMDTKLFKELKDLNTNFEKTIIKISQYKSIFMGIVVGFVFGFIFWTIMGMMECTIDDLKRGKIKTLIFALLMVAVILVITMALSVIYGVLERVKLDQALEKYARDVEDFKPNARTFCWNIGKVSELIEMHNKR
ncbi:hypothetical protein CHS0354_001925 [Potamilus streckersoni]|uniref:Uncharacterized protein n=1 Tax=Potamilus streckersoni TaxID=2493646 RepID=A0AAE0VTN4_9BIVA|nr:hypothetical protein CHS0354_001925 [Potamilus streckersoni]